MIAQLKKVIKKKGILQVSIDLGYRTSDTLYKWMQKNSVPKIAQEKVENYLRGEKK